jgi:hypothetical protein
MEHHGRTLRAGAARRRIVVLTSVCAAALALTVAVVAWRSHDGSRVGSDSRTHSGHREPSPAMRTSAGPPVPAHAYLGAWVFPNPFTQQGRLASTRRFESALGRPLNFVHLYRQFGMRIGTPSDLAYARNGKYLLLSWPGIDTRKIASGAVDSVLRRTARQVKALPTKVFFEYRWEMDRPNLSDVVHGPGAYIAAWNHLQEVFARERVKNVGWTWCPTADGFRTGIAQRYYPGDSRVDWVCADVYPTAPWQLNSYQPFSELAAPFIEWASRRRKPIMIGEMAVGRSYGTRRAAWIEQAAQYISAHRQIQAVAWFEQSLPGDPSYFQWALEGDPEALSAFAAFAGSGFFGPR